MGCTIPPRTTLQPPRHVRFSGLGCTIRCRAESCSGQCLHHMLQSGLGRALPCVSTPLVLIGLLRLALVACCSVWLCTLKFPAARRLPV